MRRPTERQAALAARQLHYHRERHRWMRDRMRDNEALLLLYLAHLNVGRVVLPGGYHVQERASSARDVVIEKLIPRSPYEQLVLQVGERRIA